MSGYKRVNFYELCRLCATNQQKDKTHIFQEEGRKIQLQNKIQSCLSLTVCENDFLPKVVCSKCLRTLEVCYSFRQECVSSESMLSSYFKNFRYTEDFKKSGKVYIKDTATKCTAAQSQSPEPAATSQASIVNTSGFAAVSEVKPMDHVPFYTLQLPAIVTNQPMDNKVIKNDSKMLQNPGNQVQGQVGYMNTINLAAIKSMPKVGTNEGLGNVVVNANGEVINIAQLVDFESIINQANLQKVKINNSCNKHAKKDKEDPIIKIDLTNNEVDGNYDTGQGKFDKTTTSHHIRNNQNKFTYAIKVEDKVNPSVIFNNLPEFNQNNFNGYSNSLYSSNLINTTGNNNMVTAPNIICNSTVEQSTVNLNILNQDLSQQPQNFPRSLQQTNNFTSNLINQQTKIVNNLPNGSTASGEDVQSSQVNNQIVKSHICEICQKSFKRREHLYQHVKLHTGFRPYTCENCNKSFMRKEHLLRHMTSHSGQKNFTCNICDKSFSRNDNLLKHKKTHEKQASYTCEICQKQFVMKHYFLAHKLTHDGDRCSLVWNVLKT